MVKPWAIYARVSTVRQGEEGTSLTTQVDACRSWLVEHGKIVGESFVFDETYTGVELWDRPKLSTLRQHIRAKDVAGVICYAIDRLARDPVHLGVILSEAEHAGVEIIFVTEPLDDSPEGQLIRFVRGYAAKVEHAKIRERSIRGKRARIQSGKLHNHASELYGYVRDKERGVRTIVETEAEIVARIFTWSGEGVPIRTIARRLNSDSVPPPSTGKMIFKDGRTPRWGHSVVYRILKEPAYKGHTQVWKFRHVHKTQRSALRPAEEWMTLPEGTTPAIVDPSLWDLVNARLSERSGDDTRNATRPHLLRGHIFCAVCGLRMYAMPEHGKTVYRCSSRERGTGPCGGRRVPGEKVETFVWEQIARVIEDPDLIVAEIKRRQREEPKSTLAADRTALQRRISKVERDQMKAARDYRELEAVAPTLKDALLRDIAMLEQDKTRLAGELAEIDRRIVAQRAQTTQLSEITRYFDAVKRNISAASFETKRLALTALGIRVIADGSDPDGWTIDGSVPIGAMSSAGVVSTSC